MLYLSPPMSKSGDTVGESLYASEIVPEAIHPEDKQQVIANFNIVPRLILVSYCPT